MKKEEHIELDNETNVIVVYSLQDLTLALDKEIDLTDNGRIDIHYLDNDKTDYKYGAATLITDYKELLEYTRYRHDNEKKIIIRKITAYANRSERVAITTLEQYPETYVNFRTKNYMVWIEY